MPTIQIDGYKFRFYSSDIDEPPHMHVIIEECVAKIWLAPVRFEYAHGYSKAEINRLLKLTGRHERRLLEAWYEHFDGA